MKQQRAFKYAAIGAAVLIPTLVIAQQQRNPPGDGTFAANTLLRANDVELLRDALADALTRLNALESNANVALTNENIYLGTEGTGEMATTSSTGTASSNCREGDVALSCNCGATSGNAISLRRSTVSGASCSCAAENNAQTAPVARTLLARAVCLDIP